MNRPTPEGLAEDHASNDAAKSAEAPASSGGLPVAVKLFLGCLGVVVVVLVVLAVGVGVGGFALKRGIESTVGSLGEHREASETLDRLSRDHPFEVPADGVVSERGVEKFVAVTNRAWEEMRSWGEDLDELREDPGSRSTLGDALGGAKAMGGAARARIVLAEALEAEGVSLGEYAWTGLTLARAARARRGRGGTSGVPEKNLRLVERHEDALPDFDSREAGPHMVLDVATFWGMTESSVWSAFGLDTLPRP